jgi:hypothetical protein
MHGGKHGDSSRAAANDDDFPALIVVILGPKLRVQHVTLEPAQAGWSSIQFHQFRLRVALR